MVILSVDHMSGYCIAQFIDGGKLTDSILASFSGNSNALTSFYKSENHSNNLVVCKHTLLAIWCTLTLSENRSYLHIQLQFSL